MPKYVLGVNSNNEKIVAFSDHRGVLSHRELADMMGLTNKVTGAGFIQVNNDVFHAYGESTSLNIPSSPTDSVEINDIFKEKVLYIQKLFKYKSTFIISNKMYTNSNIVGTIRKRCEVVSPETYSDF